MNIRSRIENVIDLKNLLVILGVAVGMLTVGVIVPSIVYQRRAASINALKASQAAQNRTDKVVAATYTNKGFEPRDITVTVGTDVAWTNESDKQMWIGSDPHPSHTGLPGFDQGGTNSSDNHHESYKSDGFWQKISLIRHAEAHAGDQTVYKYTFTRKGSWSYHNHLSPNDRGRVVVQ